MDEQIHFMHPLFPNWSGSPSFYLISMWFTLPSIYIVFHFNWISKSIECITQCSVCRRMAGKISVVPLPHVAIVQFSNIESISFVHILSRSSGRKNPFECVRLYLTYGKLFWKRNTLSGYGSDSSSGGWMGKKLVYGRVWLKCKKCWSKAICCRHVYHSKEFNYSSSVFTSITKK